MATSWLLICGLTIAIATETIGTANVKQTKSVLNDTSKELACAATCENHYGKSSPKSESWFSCHRGCRFFSLIELLSDTLSETGIRSSCATACSEAYNHNDQMNACNDGCSHQVLVKPRKSEASVAKSLQRLHLMTPEAKEAWSPGFVFRIGWARSTETDHETNEEMADDANPIRMAKDFFSSIMSRFSLPTVLSSSRTSYSYLLGKGADGKEKLVFLPQIEKPTTTTHRPPTTATHHSSSIVTRKPIQSLEKLKLLSKSTKRIKWQTKAVQAKPAHPTVTKAVPPYWMGAAFVPSDAIATEAIVEDRGGNFWDCLTPRSDDKPWLFMTLFMLFMMVFFWICGSTIFLSRQLSKTEGNKGYVRLGDDAEAKSLLSDSDELSDDEFFTQSKVVRVDSKTQTTKDGPPSYEEAAMQSASEVEVLIPSKKKFDVTMA